MPPFSAAIGVVKPRSTDAMQWPVIGLRQGRRRERNIMFEIQNYWVRQPDPDPSQNGEFKQLLK